MVLTNNDKFKISNSPVHVIHVKNPKNHGCAADSIGGVRRRPQSGIGELQMEVGESGKAVLLRQKNRVARGGRERDRDVHVRGYQVGGHVDVRPFSRLELAAVRFSWDRYRHRCRTFTQKKSGVSTRLGPKPWDPSTSC